MKPIKCRCGQEIIFLETKNHKKIPVNVPDFKDGEIAHEYITTSIEFNPETMISHFSTCPLAAQFRKPKLKSPHLLWKEANGDHKKYRELLIQHGILIPKEKK